MVASISGVIFGNSFSGDAEFLLHEDGSFTFSATGSITLAGVSTSATIDFADGDNWSVIAGASSIISVDGVITIRGAFSFSYTVGGATFTGKGTASDGPNGTTIYTNMGGSITFTRGGNTYSLAVDDGTYTDESHWSFTVSGSIKVGSLDLVVSGTMSENGSSEWRIQLSGSRAMVGKIGLSDLSGTLVWSAGAFRAEDLSATFEVGAGSIRVTGSYSSGSNWSLTGSTASLTISGGISLVDVSATLTAAETVSATFAGTLNIGEAGVHVSGAYLQKNNWALNAVVTNLTLRGSILLSDAQVVVCSQPTVGEKASLPTLTGLPSGVSQLACPAASGPAAARRMRRTTRRSCSSRRTWPSSR
jgi:hypothetical protein